MNICHPNINKFIMDGLEYSYINVSDFLQNPKAYLKDPGNYDRSKYKNICAAFDIETSKIDEEHSTMYLWSFAMDNQTYIGRTWGEFKRFTKALHDTLKLKDNARLLCWVHNLSYEWQFMKKQIKFAYDARHDCDNVFAVDPRKVVYFVQDTFIEYRDSLILTQRPLKALPGTYKLPIQKLDGDIFDYEEARHYMTPLSNYQLAYSINDVQILRWMHQRYIKPTFLHQGINIPLTATGIPRDELKRAFKKIPKPDRMALRKKLRRGFPREAVYKSVMRWLFRGGYVHTNGAIADELIDEISNSEDFKSAYPAALLQERMPWRFCYKDPSWWYKYAYPNKKINKRLAADVAWFGIFKFNGIKPKSTNSIESKSKILDSQGAIFDNGRLRSADYIRVMINELDFQIYDLYYEWESVECEGIRVASKEELPAYLKDLILKYFAAKETLERDTMDYNISKSNLNSIYGMTVTGLINESLMLNEDSKFIPSGKIKEYEKLIQNQILLPWWGIWTTSIVRFRLLSNMAKIPDSQVLYCDTDSLKLTNEYGNKWVIDTYNDKIHRINKNMYVGDYDRALFSELGTFTPDGKYYKFKALGAKKYGYAAIAKNKKSSKYYMKTNFTVAGCRKGTIEKYAKDVKKDPFDCFNNHLILDEEHSEKLTSHYNDEGFELDFVDVNGKIAHIKEGSCITLNPTTFEIKLAEDYILMIYELKKLRMIGERAW